MKIIIAIDSFKGSLTSLEAGLAVQTGVLQIHPEWQTVVVPIADGGEGMVEVMLQATQGTLVTTEVHNPCMQRIQASYGIAPDRTTAFIEMASASGLPLLSKEQRNPMKTTTFGTGELILDALQKGCTRFIIGIGGSATNDAGTGMLQALGYRFLDSNGEALGQGGEILSKIASIDTSKVHPSLKNAVFIVACDVNNPFYGEDGAAFVYAAQKGADGPMIQQLDEGLRSFAHIIRSATGTDVSMIPGSGAAGGMGGGMAAFLQARLQPGANLILETCGFNKHLTDANLIITGEGRIDRQSLMGKITGTILQTGKKAGIPVIALAGCVTDKEALLKAGFKGIHETKPGSMPLEEAMEPGVAKRNIRQTISRMLSEEISFG